MTTNATLLLVGHVLLVGTLVVLWHYLPADGSKPRFAGTRQEPLIAPMFGTALLLIGMIALGLVEYF